MTSPIRAFSVSGGNCGLQPVGTALAFEEHRHYCSTCHSYWDHEDGRCANLGRTMICDGCAHRLLGGQMRLISDSVQPSLLQQPSQPVGPNLENDFVTPISRSWFSVAGCSRSTFSASSASESNYVEVGSPELH